MDAITIVLPPVNPKLNAHNKGHWRGKLKAVKSLRQLAGFLTREQTREQWPAATIQYRFFFPNKLRRDQANAIQSQKAAIDGVVDAGLIPDDDWQHLAIAGVTCEVDRTNPRVELVFSKTTKKVIP
ncbi:MAG: hypothetical protein GY903_00985 [Fuerstiella sp.]|nr:hypothetical protein [Fuerstiella sp.]MCP4853052.1 hypothetical protein [Fuerstiella sp.]